MEFRTRHIAFSWAGLIAVVTALYHDQTSIQAQVMQYIPVFIGIIDWISAQIQKYKGIYVSASTQKP